MYVQFNIVTFRVTTVANETQQCVLRELLSHMSLSKT